MCEREGRKAVAEFDSNLFRAGRLARGRSRVARTLRVTDPRQDAEWSKNKIRPWMAEREGPQGRSGATWKLVFKLRDRPEAGCRVVEEHGPLAQLVEQKTLNLLVRGSSP